MLSVIHSTLDAIPIMTLSGRFDDLGVWIFDEERETLPPLTAHGTQAARKGGSQAGSERLSHH